jgi:cellulose synthase (UDP-forming)
VLVAFAYRLRADGLLRPTDAKVLGWERMLFPMMQWPWVLWGCIMAMRDRISGQFVDFRITPKGEAAQAKLPRKVLTVYGALAIGALLPVLLVTDAGEARGFYLLSLLNAAVFATLLALAIAEPLRHARPDWASRDLAAQFATLAVIGAMTLGALVSRGEESLHALLIGLEPVHLTRVQYVASGAGMGAPGKAQFRISPGWSSH